MRQVAVTEGDEVAAQLHFGVAVNSWGVNDLVAAVGEATDADVDELAAEYEDRYDVVPELRRGGERHSPCATVPGSSWACAPSSTTASSAPSPPTSRTSAGCASCRAWRCSD
jgi:hypothetical protein